MGKSLFDENYRYTDDARDLDLNTMKKLEFLFKEYVNMGYSPREIEYIMNTVIKDISLSYTI